jgi:hypothetical protein
VKPCSFALLLLSGCLVREVRPAPVPRVIQLLAQRPPADAREAISGIEGEPTAVLRLEGMRARLCGDPDCHTYPRLMPAFLVEVLEPDGRPRGAFNVGLRGHSELFGLDVVGLSRSTNQVEIAARLPEQEPFRIRVRAFDAAGQDLYLVLTPTEEAQVDERAALSEDPEP